MSFWFDSIANDVLFALKEASGMDNLTDKEQVLSKIEALDLSVSSIPTAQVPYFVRDMVNLKSLNLSNGMLSGTVTSEMFPEGLETLNLSNNNLSAFHFGAGLTSLRELNLSYNKIKTLPEGLSKAVSLRDLKLSDNQLEEATFSLPASLTSLNLSSNELTFLKVSPGGMGSLKELNLSQNKLSEITEDLLSGVLVYLTITDNPLETNDIIHKAKGKVFVQV